MFAVLALVALAASEPVRPECSHDREAMLALDVVAFDQTQGKGWRALEAAHCFNEGAELLREWQARHRGDFDPARPFDRLMLRSLRWHEGQMWADGGRNDLALPIFESTRQQGDSSPDVAWNFYVDGTLAFLRRDRPALETAMGQLAAVPAPPGWGNARGADGKPISMPWPQNLGALQNLLSCWKQPYLIAYECPDTETTR